MKTWLISLSFVCTIFVIGACGKKETSPAPSADEQSGFVFKGIKADKLEIDQGEVTNVTAEVTGNVNYSWSVSSGNIFGNGKQVLFGAGTCCSGEHTLSCTVVDASKTTETKSIVLKVREP